jgi:hypothetical protein
MKRNPLTWLGEHLAPLSELRALVTDQQRQIAALQMAVRQQRESSEIFEKAFQVTGFIGDYVEFGSFRGDSLVRAYFASLRVMERITSGFWDHSYDEPDATKSGFQYSWDQMRFDSF